MIDTTAGMASESELVAQLEALGQAVERVALPDGSRLLVLVRGGRILGLFGPGDQRNFLWTHPDLADAGRGRALLHREDCYHPGGDRIWLGPERDLFFTDSSFSTYRVQTGLDPGAYVARRKGSGVVLSSAGVITSLASSRPIPLMIERIVLPTADPFQSIPSSLSPRSDVVFAGFEQRTRLEIRPDPQRGPSSARLGLWSLLQLPAPGRMIIPTWSRVEPITMVGSVPAANRNITDRAIVWDMHLTDTTKIGVAGWACTGRVGYRRQLDHRSDELVVRNFLVNPAGEYADALWNKPEVRGFAVQACHAVIGDEHFNELEYHVPAIPLAGDQPTVSEDVSQVWAWRGESAQLDRIAALILGWTSHATISPEGNPK